MKTKDELIKKQKELLKLQKEAFSYEISGEGKKIDWNAEFIPLANRLQDEIVSLESELEKEHANPLNKKIKMVDINDDPEIAKAAKLKAVDEMINDIRRKSEKDVKKERTMKTKDELAEEILNKIVFDGFHKSIIHYRKEVIEAMKAYHEAVNKSITDEDIKRKCKEVYDKPLYIYNNKDEIYLAYINGAKAFRDGEIKHIEK